MAAAAAVVVMAAPICWLYMFLALKPAFPHMMTQSFSVAVSTSFLHMLRRRLFHNL